MTNAKTAWVVGGGLAAAFVSSELCLSGFKTTVWDDNGPSASKVAAGIFNPITGKYKNISWQAEEMLNALANFFENSVFKELSPFLHRIPIHFSFLSALELNDWSHKSLSSNFRKLISTYSVSSDSSQLNEPFGGLEINECGYLDVPGFLENIWAVLQKNFDFVLKRETLDLNQHFISGGKPIGKGPVLFNGPIVFCEGLKALENPLWKTLPLIPLKGELFEIEIPEYDPGYISVGGIFLLPTGNGRFIAGSTYERNPKHGNPSMEGRQNLEDSLRNKLNLPFRIISHHAGLRPTTPDRRPIIGQHPNFSNCWILNGLGTKGVLQGPWSAKVLVDALKKNIENQKIQFDLDRYIRENV